MVQRFLELFRQQKLTETVLKRDDWLSSTLGINVYNLSDIVLDEKYCLVKKIEKLCEEFLDQDLFIFTKIRTDLIEQIHLIEEIGFNLIDTNIFFQKSGEVKLKNHSQDKIDIKFADLSHKNSVGLLAYENFLFSRFHLDPFIKNSCANALKQKWVENFFLGNRGDKMIIAEYEKEPIAFLQLIQDANNLIIDMIAVSKLHQGKKIASSMIYFASKKLDHEKISVGTQISNMPSIQLYQSLGFKHISSDYVFHYHKK